VTSEDHILRAKPASLVRISLIVAATENRVIGRDGQMPWTMPSDLKYFRRITTGKPVIMGRKTFEAIGKPLPNRHNIVVSRQADRAHPGCDVVMSLEAALERAQTVAQASGADEIMILGGGQIYAAALPFADRVYFTRIRVALEGDATFPELNPAQWVLTEQKPLAADPKDQYAAETLIFDRSPASTRV
jgi:dihydrofolate reductase